MTESTLICPIKETIEEVTGFIANRSSVVRTIADMFNLDKLNIVLAENGRVNLILDESAKVSIPVEAGLALQYKNILSNYKIR